MLSLQSDKNGHSNTRGKCSRTQSFICKSINQEHRITEFSSFFDFCEVRIFHIVIAAEYVKVCRTPHAHWLPVVPFQVSTALFLPNLTLPFSQPQRNDPFCKAATSPFQNLRTPESLCPAEDAHFELFNNS